MTELSVYFVFRFIINLVGLLVLSYFCYFRASKNSAVARSFILFGSGVFIITHILYDVDISMGFAFGLFAVFTMLRYRTESISIKEMTYLFLVTAIALLTSVGQMPLLDLIILNGLICLLAYIVDSKFLPERYKYQQISYEKIENITPQNRQNLIDDLKQRTGLDIADVEIESIDFLRDTAQIKVSYTPAE